MQTFKQFLMEGMSVAQARKNLDNAKRDANSPSANFQTRETLRKAYDDLKHAKQQEKRDGGEVKTVSVEVPEDKASQIHSELHKMWKGQDGRRIPWGTFATDKENVTSFQFTDYPTGDEAVEKLIAHVKGSK